MINFKEHFKKFTLLALVLFAAVSFSPAQTTKSSAPRQEKLLNGLKLLMWNEPAADKVSVKIRIHSGAAFDTLNKEGTMALLADVLFPNESVREFFAKIWAAVSTLKAITITFKSTRRAIPIKF
jgi:predicted Zn-dependent peptidase